MKFKESIIVLASILLLTSCSSTGGEVSESSESVDSKASIESEEGYPIKISHAYGDTIIESKPERVSTIDWGNQDVPLALGIVPVSIPKANWGLVTENDILPWTDEAIVRLGGEMPLTYSEADGIDFEGINSVEPDVILAAASGITQEDYNLLSEIAPVIAYPDKPWQTSWRDTILVNSKGLGMEQEGINLVDELDALIKEKISNYTEFEGKTAIFTWINPTDLSSFYVYMPSDPRASYLTDLGFDFPQSAYDLAESSDAFSLQISSELALNLSDVDIMVAYGDPSLIETLQQDPLLGTIPAVKNGSIVFLEDGTNVSGAATQSALSIPYVIDEYLELFSEAVSKINE